MYIEILKKYFFLSIVSYLYNYIQQVTARFFMIMILLNSKVIIINNPTIL